MANDNTPTGQESEQNFIIDGFRPEDAPGIVRLFRMIYGDGYPVATYLDATRLIEENAAQRTISTVAKTRAGEVIGHTALFNSAPHPGTYESGAGVVHPDYRGGKGIFTQMVFHNISIAKSLPHIDAAFGEPVCNHPYSQKMSQKCGYVPRALEVDLMPAAAYEKEASAAGRVAAFLDFHTFKQKPHSVYLPDAYSEELRFCYDDLDDERDFQRAGATFPPGGKTVLHPEVFSFAAVARVAVTSLGEDFAAAVESLEKTLEQQNVLVIQLWLKLEYPCVGAATEILRQNGYFFGGVLLRWFDSDGMLMQKIRKRPDWEGICTDSARYAAILERVRADWQRTQQA